MGADHNENYTHSPMPERVSIIMPAYRLGSTIAANARRVLATLPEAEVLIVDDGSGDGTYEALLPVKAENPNLIPLLHEVNKGKGEALKTGFAASTGDIIVFLDGDLDLLPEQVPEFIARLSEADIVVGAKRHTMSTENYPLSRRILSRIFAFFTTAIFGLKIRETQTGLKAFKRSALEGVMDKLRLRGYAHDLEMIVRAKVKGATIVEHPAQLSAGGLEASLRLGMVWELARDTLRLLWWRVTGQLR